MKKTRDESNNTVCMNCNYGLVLSDGFVCGMELNNKNKNGGIESITISKFNFVEEVPWNCPYKLECLVMRGNKNEI